MELRPHCSKPFAGLYLSEAGCPDTHGGSGGRHSDDLASVRLMWREKFNAEAYVYSTAAQSSEEYKNLPNAHYNAKYGDSLWRGLLKFKPAGAWNTVQLRVVLNTPGHQDGLLSVSVNGTEQRFERMVWRTTPNIVVSSLFFSTFYGGSKPEHACPADTCIRFKDFRLESKPPADAVCAVGVVSADAAATPTQADEGKKEFGFKRFMSKIGL